jgi:hypothetical protein
MHLKSQLWLAHNFPVWNLSTVSLLIVRIGDFVQISFLKEQCLLPTNWREIKYTFCMSTNIYIILLMNKL